MYIVENDRNTKFCKNYAFYIYFFIFVLNINLWKISLIIIILKHRLHKHNIGYFFFKVKPSFKFDKDYSK